MGTLPSGAFVRSFTQLSVPCVVRRVVGLLKLLGVGIDVCSGSFRFGPAF